MTEPLSDARLAEIGRCFLQLGFIPDSVGQELLDEVVRTRDIPPDVLAAMESIKNKRHCYGEVYAVACYFTNLFTGEMR